MDKKVMVAMSGGVDSSAAAGILLNQGYIVSGVTLKLFDNEDICVDPKTKTCCSLKDINDAKSVAAKLGFEHYVFNFKDRFRKNVIDRFTQSYIDGLTPNPCIDCNKYIKFDEMLERAILLDNDYLATGHYAKVEFDKTSGRYLLKKAKDIAKDQTYFLYSLTQNQLSKTLFPLGDLTKPEVRKIATDMGFVNAAKHDSQDICFVQDGDYAGFIKKYTNTDFPKGMFIDKDNHALGKHKGIIYYTVGQRKGLGLSFAKPMYVISKNKDDNTVMLGDERELFFSSLIANDINLISVENIDAPMRITAKTRYSQAEVSATVSQLSKTELLVEFDEPQRAITPGQAVVFYSGDIVVGGGTIQSSK